MADHTSTTIIYVLFIYVRVWSEAMLTVIRLRKVMENRRKIQMKPRDPYYNHQLSGLTPRGNHYTNYSSTNISPTTITDPGGPTPSTSSSRSGTTRCVCNNPDSEGFMIQWYAVESERQGDLVMLTSLE